MQNQAIRSHRTGIFSLHHITFTCGEKSTTLVVRPSLLIAAAALCLVLSLSYFGATAYWVLRDDMATTAQAERREIETYYQDRIDRLKAEIHRLSSRQAVDRESLEHQVTALLRRQQDLSKRHEIVADLMARAEENGISISSHSPVPVAKPSRKGNTLAAIDEEDLSAIGGEAQPVTDPVKALGLRDSEASVLEKTAIKPTIDPEEHAALETVDHDLEVMNEESSAVLDTLAVATENQIATILNATQTLGVTLMKPKGDDADSALGGPFVPVTGGTFFDRVTRTEKVLNALHRVKNRTRLLPIARPMRNATISSHFGPRMDPFLNRLAMHTGMDFKAPYGARVFAAAPGTVMHAGRKGGYGNLVEIRHANGFTTRYAHLSKVQVAEGQHVVTGDIIGNVGSTGRSTGPHLHYEIRQSNEAIDPAAFVAAGDRLTRLLAH